MLLSFEVDFFDTDVGMVLHFEVLIEEWVRLVFE